MSTLETNNLTASIDAWVAANPEGAKAATSGNVTASTDSASTR